MLFNFGVMYVLTRKFSVEPKDESRIESRGEIWVTCRRPFTARQNAQCSSQNLAATNYEIHKSWQILPYFVVPVPNAINLELIKPSLNRDRGLYRESKVNCNKSNTSSEPYLDQIWTKSELEHHKIRLKMDQKTNIYFQKKSEIKNLKRQ